jgi:hypothetical protein
VAAQFVVMAGLVVCLCAAGLAAVTRLARGFRFA